MTPPRGSTEGSGCDLPSNIGTRTEWASCVQNIAAWAVAGTLAYYLWVKPQQREEQERKVREGHSGTVLDTLCLSTCAVT